PFPAVIPSFLFFLSPPPPSSTLFPYTTLFRSSLEYFRHLARLGHLWNDGQRWRWRPADDHLMPTSIEALIGQRLADARSRREDRSEEHTSELQSRENLVCRLLLEKKKKKNRQR